MTNSIKGFFKTTAPLLLGILCFFLLPQALLASSFEVEILDTDVELNEDIRISWQAPPEREDKRGWIGLYESGAGDRSYISWKYIDDDKDSDTLILKSKNSGNFEARFFQGGRYDLVAKSGNKVEIGTQSNESGNTDSSGDDSDATGNNSGSANNNNSGNYSVKFNDTNISVGDSIVIDWTAPSNRELANGWIGLYKPGASDRQYLAWKYIDRNKDSGAVTLSYKIPGNYEARYLEGNGYKLLAKSTSNLTIESQSSSGGGNGSNSGSGGGDNSGQDNNNQGGAESYSLSLSSTNINEGGSVTVTWSANNAESIRSDWLALYKVGNSNRQYLDWTYTRASNGSKSFKINDAGKYEFRYLKNNGYVDVAKSSVITVGSQTGGGGSNQGGGGSNSGGSNGGNSGSGGGNQGGGSGGGSVGQCNLSCQGINCLTAVQNAQNFPPKNGPIIAFGDSLTSGVGSTAGNDYVSQLERSLGIDIENKGISGNTTKDALARLNRDVLSEDPSVVIIWLGGNDIIGRFYEDVQDGLEEVSFTNLVNLILLKLSGKIPDPQGITERQTFENLETIINRVQATGATTVLVGFSGGVFDDDLELMYEKVALETNSVYVRDALGGVIGRPIYMSDLVHPNNTGYGLVADKIEPYISCLASRQQ